MTRNQHNAPREARTFDACNAPLSLALLNWAPDMAVLLVGAGQPVPRTILHPDTYDRALDLVKSVRAASDVRAAWDPCNEVPSTLCEPWLKDEAAPLDGIFTARRPRRPDEAWSNFWAAAGLARVINLEAPPVVGKKELLSRRKLLAELQSERCRCGAKKRRRQTFCRVCYFRLPWRERQALYDTLGAGYESYADGCERSGDDGSDLVVREVE